MIGRSDLVFEAQERPLNRHVADRAAAVAPADPLALLPVLPWDILAAVDLELVDAVPAAHAVTARLTGRVSRTKAAGRTAETRQVFHGVRHRRNVCSELDGQCFLSSICEKGLRKLLTQSPTVMAPACDAGPGTALHLPSRTRGRSPTPHASLPS